MKTSTDKTASAYPSKESADKIIRHHVWGSVGLGLIPLPIVDFAAITAVQLNMLRKLAGLYQVPFRKDKVKNILSALVGGAFPSAVSGPLAASIAKSLPLIGQTAGAATMPLLAGATTYSLGKVFVQHFASGGTFLTFDPEEVRAYYADMFKEGESAIKASEVSHRTDSSTAAEGRVEAFDEPAEPSSVSLSPADSVSDAPGASGSLAPDIGYGGSADQPSAPQSDYGISEPEVSGAEISYSSAMEGAEGGMTDISKPKRKKKRKKEIS